MHPKHCHYVLGAKRSHLDPISNFVSSRPVPVVFGPRKVVKIWLKHSSAILTENDKNHTPNSVVCFGCKIDSSVPDFQPFQLWCFPGPKKLSKFDRNIFLVYGQETMRTTPQIVCLCFGSKTYSSKLGFLSLSAPVVSVPRTVVEIQPKQFSVVLIGNDKKHTPKHYR